MDGPSCHFNLSSQEHFHLHGEWEDGETGLWSNKGEKENRIFPALFLRRIQRGLLRPHGEIAAGVKPKLCLCREDQKNSLVLSRDSKSPFAICGKSVLSAVHDADWGCVSVCAVFVQYDAAQLFLTLWNLLKKQIRKPELVRMVTGMNLCPLSCVVSSAPWRIPFTGNCPKLNFLNYVLFHCILQMRQRIFVP